MSEEPFPLYQVVERDPRYPVEAYLFVREALSYAADTMELGAEPDELGLEHDQHLEHLTHSARRERHLTGQQLCEAIRRFALNQFGYMARVVFRNWNISQTSCFGDIVYNMIDAGIMKKSSQDVRADFDNVFEFESVFQTKFEMCDSVPRRRLV